LIVETVIFCVDDPALKVRVPLNAVKSLPASAVPFTVV